jgi:putative methyltransferase (TIGR04325 family)
LDIRDLPVFRPLLEARYRRRFYSTTGMGAWYGDFPTFEAAAAAAPRGAPIGYDNEGTASLYDDWFFIDAKDFPVLFWLEKVLEPGARIFDFGGHVGHTCLAYREMLTKGSTLSWEVYDVAAVVEEGTRRVTEKGIERLSFTTDFSHASGVDVLHAAGSLQYEQRHLTDMLQTLPQKPRYVIINRTPTIPDSEMVTLQNIGPAFCPYRIDAKSRLPDGLRKLGYEQMATWENIEGIGRTFVPYSDRARKVTWVGYCFRLK